MKWNFEEIFLSNVCLFKGDRIKERRVIYTIDQIRSEILNQICKSIKEFKGNLLILLNRKSFNRSGLNKAEIALKADLT